MDVFQIIKKRRSVRKFLPEKVSIEALAKILEAANYAPAAGNIQNSRFIIVEDDAKKEDIANAALKQMWFADAPALIVVCSDDAQLTRFYKNRGEFYAAQNSALGIENRLTTAASLDIASCFVSAFDEIKLKACLRIPENIKIMAIVAFGYSREVSISKKIPLQFITYFDAWGNKERKQVSISEIAEKGKKKIEGIRSKLKH